MIKTSRAPCPAILKNNAAKWRQSLRRAVTPEERTSAQEKYRHREVKQALKEMFYGKCAYCESKILHVDYGHIEHFRPKSRYISKTFAWANLYLACGLCNGPEHKGDRFPLRKDGGPLIDPCDDDPAEHLVFEYDDGVGALVTSKTLRGETMRIILGLNREELAIYRTRTIKKIVVIARLARTDAAAKVLWEEIRNAAQIGEYEFSAFIRSLSIPVTRKRAAKRAPSRPRGQRK